MSHQELAGECCLGSSGTFQPFTCNTLNGVFLDLAAVLGALELRIKSLPAVTAKALAAEQTEHTEE